MTDTPRLIVPDDPALPAVLNLIRAEFAYMDEVIDPPSSVHRLTLADLAAADEVWVMGEPPVACAVFTVQTDKLYLGKIAVLSMARRLGHARALIDHAGRRARSLGLNWLELQTRVELVANQRAFESLGFVEVTRTAHPGYSRPTSITYRKPAPRSGV